MNEGLTIGAFSGTKVPFWSIFTSSEFRALVIIIIMFTRIDITFTHVQE